MGGSGDWTRARQTWLEPFLARLGHPARRRMCPLYVAGLMGPGERKSLQPIAARLAPADYDQLHHFIAVGPWDDEPLEAELLAQADRLVGGPDAILVIDDTALPKKGQLSVGVAPQYASALGKNANCQTLVSLTLAQGEVPVPIALRLFLPEAWTQDPERMRRAGVPEACQTARANRARQPRAPTARANRARQARDRPGRTEAGPQRRCSLPGRGGGCRLWDQRRLSPGALGFGAAMGCRDPAHPEGLSCRGAVGACSSHTGATAQDTHPGPTRGRPRK